MALLDLLNPVTGGPGTGGGGTGGGSGGGTGGGGGGTGAGTILPLDLLGDLGNGLISIDLLNDDAIVKLGLLDLDEDGDGLIALSVLDQDLDGLIDPGLFGNGPDLTGLDLSLLDDLLADLLGPTPDGPVGPTDPDEYEVVLTGTAGMDSFMIDAKATYVDGRGGVDTAIYAAASTGFTYELGANGVFIGNGTKIDYLLDVERVEFSDGTLMLDTGAGEIAGEAYRLYQAAFDRAPDAAGLAFWIDRLESGDSLQGISAGFIASVEFRQTYGTDMSDRTFVETLYENVLGRSGEAAGIAYWTKELSTGAMSEAQVLAGFSESQENVQLVATVIGEGFFLA